MSTTSEFGKDIFHGVYFVPAEVDAQPGRKTAKRHLAHLTHTFTQYQDKYSALFERFKCLPNDILDSHEVPRAMREACSHFRMDSSVEETMYGMGLATIMGLIKTLDEDLRSGAYEECLVMMSELSGLLEPIRSEVRLTNKAVKAYEEAVRARPS